LLQIAKEKKNRELAAKARDGKRARPT